MINKGWTHELKWWWRTSQWPNHVDTTWVHLPISKSWMNDPHWAFLTWGSVQQTEPSRKSSCQKRSWIWTKPLTNFNAQEIYQLEEEIKAKNETNEQTPSRHGGWEWKGYCQKTSTGIVPGKTRRHHKNLSLLTAMTWSSFAHLFPSFVLQSRFKSLSPKSGWDVSSMSAESAVGTEKACPLIFGGLKHLHLFWLPDHRCPHASLLAWRLHYEMLPFAFLLQTCKRYLL